ncbi:serine hydrolase domain-containing protein [Allosphingosinicella indica]|uniref:CubicO group peptidase, beta-lactamase class C family n=1 Tax=Allosphingosinicella indica TaxID=941907 RepID=A0A1X7FZ69_9SPHN|nr:serine hydrolase domain-containing protein [Allosphingosinicella indica]SMF61381.1 CubicO group peptidase, beta-lactamase class C family [Allosphingosinicella indica]
MLKGMVWAALLAAAAVPAIAAAPVRGADFGAIKARLTAECAADTFSGIVLVRAGGRDLFEHVCGKADIINGIANARETRFKIYSTSKFITALTVLKLVEDGRMRLDAPVTDYIADAPGEWRGVTIRMLLNHTSGIDDLTLPFIWHFRADHPSAMRGLLPALTAEQRALKSAPGTAFRYNNFGFELLADAAAKAGGQPFPALVEALVFQPAGMKSASIEAPLIEAGHLVPVSAEGLAKGYNGDPGKLDQAINWGFVQQGAGAVHASVDDFVALDAALKAGRILGPAMLAEMTRAPVDADGKTGGQAFGLGVVVNVADGVTMYGHTGGTNGYISDFERYPDDDAMLIVLTNRGNIRTAWLREGVAAALKGAR